MKYRTKLVVMTNIITQVVEHLSADENSNLNLSP